MRWELISRLKQGFWKQWSEEFLQELQARHKWKTVNANIKEDMLVLIKEDNIPVMSWPMGRIVKTYPGQDNHVRVVDVKTASGIFKRPITRLAPLFPEEMAKKRPINEPENTDTTDAPIAQRKRLMSPTISSSMLILLLMLPLHYRHLYDELQMANVLMQHTRKRRSPFDAVGNIANSLLGVLDSNYANEMTKVIKKVQTNEEFVLSLLKNQTSVLDSTINVVKKTRATSDKHLRLLEQQFAAIVESRGKYTGSRLTETYLALTTQLTLLAATLQRMQSEIVDVLTGIHHHTISAILVSPDQLKNQLDQKRVHLPPNQMLPVTSSNCILWREDPSHELKAYKLDTVTYGTKPAAFLAIRAMHQLAFDEEHDFPIGAKIVRRDFYVDDLMSGGDTVDKVKEIRRQVKDLLLRGHFPIRKWCSNDPAALEGEPECDREKLLKLHDDTDFAKALGLVWNPSSDCLLFNFSQIIKATHFSKRSVLATIARFYDPLGLIAPIITKSKIFLQALWKSGVTWDEDLHEPLYSAWSDLISQFAIVQDLKFPRFAMLPSASYQLHAFCDASISAYGACVYLRSEINGSISSQLLCAKSRIAPLKTLTIPKLELSAALLISELLSSVKKSVSFACDIYCWSDSSIVLSWIDHASSDFKIFVSNRIAQIQEMTRGMAWRHVPTELNPADIISRGCFPKELLDSVLWLHGPPFLVKSITEWPKPIEVLRCLPELRVTTLVGSAKLDVSINCKYHNSFGKLQRIFAYVYRFLSNCKKDIQRTRGALTVHEVSEGTSLLIKGIQQVHFFEEHKALSVRKPIPLKSKLLSLRPELGPDGLLRVGGRLQNSFLDYDAMHPIILPKDHAVTRAIIQFYHRKYLHAGPQALLASLRQKYWPVGGKKDQFMGLTHDDLRRCFALPNEEYICFDHQAVFNVNNRCELQFFNNKTPTMCQTTHRTTKMVWEKPYQPNKWIFATRSTMELQAVCDGTPTTIQLEDTGVLSLSSGCTARNFEISISTFGNIISQARQSYVRFGDIVKPNNTIAPAPKINIPKYTVQEDKDLDDLQLKLATLKNQELPNQISSVQHHHIAAYAALMVSTMLLCAYALRKQRLWTLRPTVTRNKTANPSAPSASPRRFTLDLEEG
ncbi:hypothetical protein ACLKA6_002594 [Drosophila palustris]